MPDLLDPRLDRHGLAGTLDDRGVVLVDDHLLGPTQLRQAEILELHAQVLEHGRGTGDDRYVLHHRLPAVAVPRGLHGADLEGASQPVDDERSQRLAVHLLRDDQERLARVHHGLEQRDDVLHARDLLLEHKDVAVFEHALHLLRAGDKVGGEVAAVELHALDPFHLGLEALALVDGDHAVLADLVHGLGKELTNFHVVVGGDRRHLRHLFLALHRDRHLFELGGDLGDRLLDAGLHLDRIHARHDSPQAFVEDSLGQHRRGRRAVTGHVAGLAGHFAHHAGAHVFVDILQVDFLGDCHAVLGDRGRTEALLQDDVAALGAKRHLHGTGQLGDTATHCLTRFLIECHHLGHKSNLLGKGAV